MKGPITSFRQSSILLEYEFTLPTYGFISVLSEYSKYLLLITRVFLINIEQKKRNLQVFVIESYR